ncbi:hypothetical protein K4F52_005943 [Lecanicillium sp. MT-2017a]|nr:hypothetical protein K4F52_005943 [Lecanicillium sp. MT-2017a]
MATENANLGSNSLNSHSRLQKIDRLRELDVSSNIPLPQLVVVGDQSSGKSALLETLTGIPFPRSHKRCTRYATQISQYRQDVDIVRVSIIPVGHKESSEERQKLEGYHEELDSPSDLHRELPLILEHVDVPGIFRVPDKYATEADISMVQAMAEEYIKNERTIVLAVVPSNSDPDTQDVLRIARQHDPDGKRTLGILTKPDLVKEKTIQNRIRELIEMKDMKTGAYLALGYYVVVNRGSDESGPDQASVQQREELFKEEPWCSLPKGRVGITALKARLQELLGHLTDREFPALRVEARNKLTAAQKELATLGGSRATERQQQQYLVSMAGKFQHLVRAASNADYSAHKAFDDNDELRLITAVINETDRFNSEFLRLSHTHHFQNDSSSDSDSGLEMENDASSQGRDSGEEDEEEEGGGEEEEEGGEEDGEEANNEDDGDDSRATFRAKGSKKPINQAQEPDPSKFSELGGIINMDWKPSKPDGDIMKWIERMYRRSRGVELGTFGSGLLANAFREQSKKWEPITRLYLSRIIYIIHNFIMKALREVCADERVRAELESSIIEAVLARYKHAMDQVEFLAAVEREKRPFTLNDYFSSHLQTLRINRLTNQLQGKAKPGKDNKWVVDLRAVESAVEGKTNEGQATEDVHDILEAYYQVARERFVDNVYQQVVDYALLTKENSPLRVFSEAWVLSLDSERLAVIAGETPMTRDRRDALERQIKSYEAALKVLL